MTKFDHAGMTAAQRIKAHILSQYFLSQSQPAATPNATLQALMAREVTTDSVDEIFELADEDCALQDWREEFRCNGLTAEGLKPMFDRHYEVDMAATELEPGVWVSWPYYFGGGKHGEPSAMPWLEEAVFVEILSTRIIEVHTFKELEQKGA